MNKHFPRKRTFSLWWPLLLTVLDWSLIWGNISIAEIHWLSFGYLTILLASIVIEIIAIFCENSPTLWKYDLCWPPVTSNLTWSKNDLSMFYRTCQGLSNAVYHLSLSFLVFEFSGGAVIRPPAVRRWLRPPAVRGLSSSVRHCINVLLRPRKCWCAAAPPGRWHDPTLSARKLWTVLCLCHRMTMHIALNSWYVLAALKIMFIMPLARW